MTRGPHPFPRDRDDEDVDPTGIRDLLARLPEPGPMPEDLVRRIEARLHVERAAQAGSEDGPAPGRVAHLRGERARRRPARALALAGAAAAGLVVTTVALSQVMGPGSEDTSSAGGAAQYPTTSDPSVPRSEVDPGPEGTDDDGAAGALGGGEALPEQGMSGLSGGDEGGADLQKDGPGSRVTLTGDLVVLGDLGAVTADDFAPTIHQAMQEHRTGDGDTPGRGVADLTVSQAGSCWHAAADQASFEEHFAAAADHAGDPVVVLLGVSAGGTGDAWLVPWACTVDPDTRPVRHAVTGP